MRAGRFSGDPGRRAYGTGGEGFAALSAVGQLEAVLGGTGVGILHRYIAEKRDTLVRLLSPVALVFGGYLIYAFL